MGLQKDISDACREEIVQILLLHCKNGKPERDKIGEVAAKFSCSSRTVSRIWKSARNKKERGECIKVATNRHGKGNKPAAQINIEQIEQVHYQKRGTIRALDDSINVPKTTVGRWVKENLIRVHTNAIKPELTAPNKLLRLGFSLQAIEYHEDLNVLKFKPMENVIHIDEKWFYLTKNTHRYYMSHREKDPHRFCKSKKFIPKIMFMCAVCRPIFSEEGAVVFDGKIGIWPFTEEVQAKRNSKNRQAGTMELKPIESITKEVIKNCLVNQIIPAIKARWPSCLSKTIFIQQDNARPHITDMDPDFRSVANADGFTITLVQQPPNSPDVNVNDLGFFRAIQCLQQQQTCRNANDLVNAVISSFNRLEPMTLNKVFITLQSCLEEILKIKGCNNYKIPHMKKDALILQHELPRNLEIPMQLVKECIQYMIEEGKRPGNEKLMLDLAMEMVYMVMQ